MCKAFLHGTTSESQIGPKDGDFLLCREIPEVSPYLTRAGSCSHIHPQWRVSLLLGRTDQQKSLNSRHWSWIHCFWHPLLWDRSWDLRCGWLPDLQESFHVSAMRGLPKASLSRPAGHHHTQKIGEPSPEILVAALEAPLLLEFLALESTLCSQIWFPNLKY